MWLLLSSFIQDTELCFHCVGRYAKALVLNSLPMLTLHMALAVCVFWFVQSLYGVGFPLIRVLLSFVGWSSIGNSNWFIFVTLLSYVVIALGYGIFHRVGQNAVAVSTLCLLILANWWLVCVKGQESYWYNTNLCIPAGMFFYIWRNQIELLMRKLWMPSWCCGVVLVPASLVLYRLLAPWPYLNNISAILFAFGVTLIFFCISVQKTPRFLCWSLFFVYIFQRIPMLVGAKEGWNHESPFIYQLFCFVATLAIAWLTSKVLCAKLFPVSRTFFEELLKNAI